MATGTREPNGNKSTIWKRRGWDEGQFINKCPSHFMGTHQSCSCNTKRGRRVISYARLHSVEDCVISKENSYSTSTDTASSSALPVTLDYPSCNSSKRDLTNSECRPSHVYGKTATHYRTCETSEAFCFYGDRRQAWMRGDSSARTGEDSIPKKISEQCRKHEPKVYSLEELAERRGIDSSSSSCSCRSGRHHIIHANYGNLGENDCYCSAAENIYSRWPPFSSRSLDREQLPESSDEQSSDDRSCGVSNAKDVFSEEDGLFQSHEGECREQNEVSLSISNGTNDDVSECEIPLLTNHSFLPPGEVVGNKRGNWSLGDRREDSAFPRYERGWRSIPAAKRGFVLGLLNFLGYRRIDFSVKLKSEKTTALRQSSRDYSIDQDHATALISDTDTSAPSEVITRQEASNLIAEELTHGHNHVDAGECALNLKTLGKERADLNNRCRTDLINLEKGESFNRSAAWLRKVDKTEDKSLQISSSSKGRENIEKERRAGKEKEEEEAREEVEVRKNIEHLASVHYNKDFDKDNDSILFSSTEENVARVTNNFGYAEPSRAILNRTPHDDDIICALTNSSIDYSCHDVTSHTPGPSKLPSNFSPASSPALITHTVPTIDEKRDLGVPFTSPPLVTIMRSAKLSKIGQLTTRAPSPSIGDRTASGIDRVNGSGSGQRRDDVPAVLARNAQRAWTTDDGGGGGSSSSSSNLISTAGGGGGRGRSGGDAGDRNSNIDIDVCVGGAICKSDAAIDSRRGGGEEEEEEAVSRQRDKTQTYIMENIEKEKESERTGGRERVSEKGKEGESCSNKPSPSLEPEVEVVVEKEEEKEGKITEPKLRDEALVRNARPEEAISAVVAADRSISVRADGGIDGGDKNEERLNDRRLKRLEQNFENCHSSTKIVHPTEKRDNNLCSAVKEGHCPGDCLETALVDGSQERNRSSFECSTPSTNLTPEFEISPTVNPVTFSSFGKTCGTVLESRNRHISDVDPGKGEEVVRSQDLNGHKRNEKQESKIEEDFLHDTFQLETHSAESRKGGFCKDRDKQLILSDHPKRCSFPPQRPSEVLDRHQHQNNIIVERQQEVERQEAKSQDGRLQTEIPAEGQTQHFEMKEAGMRASTLVYANQSTIDSASIHHPLSPCLPISPLNPATQHRHLQGHQSPIILSINPVDIRNKRLSHQYLNCAITGQTYPDFLPQELQQNPLTTSPRNMIFTATTTKETSFTSKPNQNGFSKENAFIPISAEKQAPQEASIISLGSPKPGFGSVNGGLDSYKMQHLPPAASSASVHHYYNNKSIFSPVSMNNGNGVSCMSVPEQRRSDGGEGYKFYSQQRNPIHNMNVGAGTPCGVNQQSQNSLESTIFCQSDCCAGGSSGGGICSDNSCSVRTFAPHGQNQENRSHSAIPFHLLQQHLQPHQHHHPGNPFPPANYSAEELQRLLQSHHHHQQQQISSDPRQQFLLSSLAHRSSCQPSMQTPRTLLDDAHHHHHQNHQQNTYNNNNHGQQNQFDDCDGDSLIQSIICFKHRIRFSPVSLLWTFLSFLVAGSCLFSFLTPYWIVHPDHAHSFGLFNLCVADPRYTVTRSICINYGAQRFITRTTQAQNGTVEELAVIFEGSGSTDIRKIPSGAWQTACLLFGAGCCVQILGAVLSAVVLALSDPWHRKIALANGYLQAVGVLLLFFGLLIYPAGFSSPFFTYYCESTRPFDTGHCSLGWSYVTAIMTSALSIFCPVMSNFSEAQQTSSRKTGSLTSGGPDM